jgi:hypothetical protein
MLLLPTPIDLDLAEQNSFVVLIHPATSGLAQLTPAFEQFTKQILALGAILSCRSWRCGAQKNSRMQGETNRFVISLARSICSILILPAFVYGGRAPQLRR